MLLKALSELNGTSGAETAVRDFLREYITPYAERVYTDKIGNLIAEKGSALPGPKVMLAAHMDEVALMITEITTDGFLRFRTVGGIDPRILLAKPVLFAGGLTGVIGAKAIHLQKKGERQKALGIENLAIDIGAKSREEASGKVKLGDYAYFTTKFQSLGEGYYKGKAFDDRVGCAILADLLKQDYPFPFTAAFTVQEEVGLRGAKVAAYHVNPDFALVLETTVANDITEDGQENWITELGQGAACSLLDRSTLFQPKLIRWLAEVARQKDIPFQLRQGGGGGNDAGSIHVSRSGVPTLALSVPCRYIHSFVSVIAEKDYQACYQLADALLREFPAFWEAGLKEKEEDRP